MALNDVYQARLFMLLPEGQPSLNVFWYQETGGGSGNSAELAAAFEVGVKPSIRSLMPIEVEFDHIQILNTNDFNDNGDFGFVLLRAGLYGNILDLSQAIAFRKREGGIGTRYSYKRFPAPGSALVVNTRVWNATAAQMIYDTSVALGANLVGTLGTYTPVQVKGGWTMECTTSNPTYCGEGNVVVNGDISGQWQVDLYASHQDSREESQWSLPADPV